MVKPRLLDGKVLPGGSRRAALADWVVSRDNPRFARNLVNRVWDQLFGGALVPNLDNPALKTESLAVLGVLSEDFAQTNHDLRRLLRIVVLSKTYSQTSSARARANAPWARPAARPMSVDQLHASIAQATGHDGAAEQPAEERANDDNADAHADPGTARSVPRALPPQGDGDDVDERGKDDADVAADALGERPLTLQRALVLQNAWRDSLAEAALDPPSGSPVP